jgi:hypothetical protein
LFCGGAVVFFAASGFLVYRSAQHVPEFYRQALAVEPQRQEESSKELLQQATTLVNEVRKEGAWQALFTEEQINGWLAVDLVRNHPKALTKEIHDPRVSITPAGLNIGCRWESEKLHTIFSMRVELTLAEPNVIAMRIHGARAGALPLPLSKILEGVSRAARKMDVHLEWLQVDGDPVAMITIPPIGDLKEQRVVVVETLELRQGSVYLAGKTVPRSEMLADGEDYWDSTASRASNDTRHR